MLVGVQNKLDKYYELGGAASKILTSFENRLKKLELTILPVYNETEHLQTRQQSTLNSNSFLPEIKFIHPYF